MAARMARPAGRTVVQGVTAAVLPGAVRQLGHVVPDIDEAISTWLSLGVGPWFVMRDIVRQDSYFRGVPCPARLSLALANSGPMQIELIEPRDDVPNLQLEFLQGGRQGFHHIAYWTEDFDAVLAAAVARGWGIAQTSGGRSAYFEFPGAVVPFVEVMELNARTTWLADTVLEAAANWDGRTQPVRHLPKRPGW
jgi:hypothetical protein